MRKRVGLLGVFLGGRFKSDLLAWRSWRGVYLIREDHGYNFCLVVAWAFPPTFPFLPEYSSTLLKQSQRYLRTVAVIRVVHCARVSAVFVVLDSVNRFPEIWTKTHDSRDDHLLWWYIYTCTLYGTYCAQGCCGLVWYLCMAWPVNLPYHGLFRSRGDAVDPDFRCLFSSFIYF